MNVTVLGGVLHPEIELTIDGMLPVSDTELRSNLSHAVSLGLPKVRQFEAAGRPLAVVGGGPSINDHVDAIQAFQGEVWAINGAWKWCQERGVDATFLGVDPHPIVTTWAQGVTRAILATQCHPSTFDYLKGRDVRTFSAGDDFKCGSSAAGCVPHLSAYMAYGGVTFFGCESSYGREKTHAYQHEQRPDELLIECGGEEFLTAPDFYMQAKELATLIIAIPEHLREESGGLLRAMIANQNKHRIRWVSAAMAKGLTKIEKPVTADNKPVDVEGLLRRTSMGTFINGEPMYARKDLLAAAG